MTVEIFADCEFSGTASGALNQDYTYIGDFWNDKISSIKVYSDTWEFFADANYQGKSFQLQPGNYPTLTNGWNDVISSIKKVGTAPSSSPSPGSAVQRVFDLTNIERSKVGVPLLRLNTQLTAAAQAHTDLMVRYGKMTHDSFPGELPFDKRLQQYGYPGGNLAENIAHGQHTPEDVMQTWMNSPLHRQNLLSPTYRDLGVGYANTYWTQTFGA